jgi:hypothetical protein
MKRIARFLLHLLTSDIGPSRRFAATQQTVAFRCIATVGKEWLMANNLPASNFSSDTLADRVGAFVLCQMGKVADY